MIALDTTSRHSNAGTSVVVPGTLTEHGSPQAAVAELGRAALSGFDIKQVLNLAADLIRETLGVDYVEILHQVAPHEPLILVAGRGWPDGVVAEEATISYDPNSQAGYTLMSTGPVLFEDLADERRFSASPLHVEHGVVSGISVAIPDGTQSFGVLGAYTRHRRTFTAGDGDLLQSIADVIGAAVQSDRTRQQIHLHSMLQDRRLRYQVALSTAAQSLLSTTGAAQLEHAAEALLTAAQTTHVFVRRNATDPDLGFSSMKVIGIERPETPGNDPDCGYWDIVAWSRMPTSRSHLEQREPFAFLPDELEGVEFDLHAADPSPIQSGLHVPIFTQGEWTGLIGLADTSTAREWTEEDLSLLTTAAAMIGAFWELETTRERREQAIRTNDSFLASVSHELRTPLSAVLGFGQILQDEGGSLSAEERSELVETVVRQATDLTNIVNDLLVAAKTDTGTLQVTKVPVTLRAQTAQALESFEHEEASHITLVGQPGRAVGDPQRVRQIVRNLVSNALRYGGDTIRVEVTANDDTARVLVCDSGPPIPARDRDRIFEQYQRAQNVPKLAESLGLGLAISRQLARRMGGDLTYRHEDGESVFELALPTAE